MSIDTDDRFLASAEAAPMTRAEQRKIVFAAVIVLLYPAFWVMIGCVAVSMFEETGNKARD